MKIYIAGPMRSLPGWNFAEFDAAEQRWRAAGHQPFSPAAADRALGYTPEYGGDMNRLLRHVITLDVVTILAADAIALLPGWEMSAGTTVELALALFLDLPVYDAVTMSRIYPDKKPWRYLPRARPPEDDAKEWEEAWARLREKAAQGYGKIEPTSAERKDTVYGAGGV